MEAATNLRVSQVQADWGGEFRNKDLEEELRQHCITSKESVPRHSETNTAIERTNRTILTMSRIALIGAELPRSLWDKASAWATHTKNRVPYKALKGKTPIKIFLQKNVRKERTNLRPFGRSVICFNYEVKDKMSSRCYEARIIGYSSSFGTYWVRTLEGAVKLAKIQLPYT